MKTNVSSQDMDEPDESPHEEMNIVRGTEGSRRRLCASTCAGGFAEVAAEDPGVSDCCLEGAMLSGLPNVHSVFFR